MRQIKDIIYSIFTDAYYTIKHQYGFFEPFQSARIKNTIDVSKILMKSKDLTVKEVDKIYKMWWARKYYTRRMNKLEYTFKHSRADPRIDGRRGYTYLLYKLASDMHYCSDRMGKERFLRLLFQFNALRDSVE